MVKVRGSKPGIFLLFIFLAVILFSPAPLLSKSEQMRPHGDKNKLPKGCASCHKGHGRYNTPMLSEGKESFCFKCHGNSLDVEKAMRKGDISPDTKASDIEREFEKPFRHPVEKNSVHRFGETLPETDPSLPRHAACGDCHHHHLVSYGNKMSGMRGTNAQGALIASVRSEYELCFNCHSYSVNLPSDQSNKAELFDISNPSYHPVIASGKNYEVPSLMPPLNVASTLRCTDCHNNDDPKGPRGPHGSTHKYILSNHFSEADGPESPFQYELCYRCHRRSSILGNEGFQYHNVHVAIVGTSCRTCHNPHGSRLHPHLIDLDQFTISPSSQGRLEFTDMGPNAGQCYLKCHNKDHNPAIYPSNQSPSVQTEQQRTSYPRSTR